jgi:hypothetical protein
MVNRRRLLHGLGASALATWVMPETAGSMPASKADGPTDLVAEYEQAEDLLYELARLNARYYSEEGVAMVLACENLVPGAAESSADAFFPGAMNHRFRSAFRHYAELLDALRVDLAAEDATAVIEFVSYKDFESRGGGSSR